MSKRYVAGVVAFLLFWVYVGIRGLWDVSTTLADNRRFARESVATTGRVVAFRSAGNLDANTEQYVLDADYDVLGGIHRARPLYLAFSRTKRDGYFRFVQQHPVGGPVDVEYLRSAPGVGRVVVPSNRGGEPWLLKFVGSTAMVLVPSLLLFVGWKLGLHRASRLRDTVGQGR